MKKIRWAFAVLALVLALGTFVVGCETQPVAANPRSGGVIIHLEGVQVVNKEAVTEVFPGYFYLPAGQYIQAVHGSCVARFIYANFGNVAFTRMEALNYGCSTLSRVMTQAWGDTSTACSYLHQHSSYPDCDHADNWVQAVAVGQLIGGYWQIHDGASSGEVWFSPIP